VRKTIDDWEAGETESAMLHACNAIDGTAAKVYPGGNRAIYGSPICFAGTTTFWARLELRDRSPDNPLPNKIAESQG
jgi:hypothetical protein